MSSSSASTPKQTFRCLPAVYRAVGDLANHATQSGRKPTKTWTREPSVILTTLPSSSFIPAARLFSGPLPIG